MAGNKLLSGLLGASYSSEEIKTALEFAQAPYQLCNPSIAAADALVRDEIVAWFQGRAEVGPRALGNRSILAHPGIAGNLDRVNKKVKRREKWRPLAPSVLAERHNEIFDLPHPSPFMLLAGQVRVDWRNRLPAIVHVDGSARPQKVSKNTNALYYELIQRCREGRERLGGLLNTIAGPNNS